VAEHCGAITPRIRDGNDKVNWPARPLRQCESLELSCSQLSLKVEQRSLHLYDNQSSRTFKHHINRSPVWRRTDRNLQLNAPDRRCGGSDRLGDAQLPGVPQADAIGRIQAQDKVMACRSGDATHHPEARHRPTIFDLANQSLGDTGSQGQLRLRQT
jgi:hypothetical protein